MGLVPALMAWYLPRLQAGVPSGANGTRPAAGSPRELAARLRQGQRASQNNLEWGGRELGQPRGLELPSLRLARLHSPSWGQIGLLGTVNQGGLGHTKRRCFLFNYMNFRGPVFWLFWFCSSPLVEVESSCVVPIRTWNRRLCGAFLEGVVGAWGVGVGSLGSPVMGASLGLSASILGHNAFSLCRETK